MLELHGMRDEESPNIYEEAYNIDEEGPILDDRIEFDKMLSEGLNDDWNKLTEDDLKIMYVTCKLSHLMTILQIIILHVVHGWTNESVELEEISTQNGPFNPNSNSMASCVSQ